jgi:hypothetical protein
MTNILKKLAGVPEQIQLNEQRVNDSLKDFERVVHTLSSCVNEAHLEVADNYFQVFKNKWKNISEDIMDYNYLIFCKERERLLTNLMEKRSVEFLLA